MTTLNGLCALIVEPNLASRTRLRECLAQIIYKGKVEFARSPKEAIAILTEGNNPCDALFISSETERDQLVDFFAQTKEARPNKTPMLIVCLKSKQQDSTYVASLFMLGVHGFVKEPYSSQGLYELLSSAQAASQVKIEKDSVKIEAVLRFMVSDACRHINAVAQNMVFGKPGGYAQKGLEASAKTIHQMAQEIKVDAIERILIDRFSDAKVPKGWKGRAKGLSPVRKRVSHPGVRVREVMQSKNLTAERFKGMWKLEPEIFDGLVQEKETITSAVALELARILGQNPQYWTGLQDEFDRYIASLPKKKTGAASHAP